MYVVKREPLKGHICYTPPQTENKPIVAGDIWKCDECGKYHLWKPSDTSLGWSEISPRRAKRETQRWAKGKPFKQRCGHGTGPG